MSCYPRAGANPKPEELESCAVKYDAELKAMGFDLKKWTDKPVRDVGSLGSRAAPARTEGWTLGTHFQQHEQLCVGPAAAPAAMPPP